MVFATDKKAAENGIYAYYVKQDGKIVSNVEFYYKKVRIKKRKIASGLKIGFGKKSDEVFVGFFID